MTESEKNVLKLTITLLLLIATLIGLSPIVGNNSKLVIDLMEDLKKEFNSL